MQENTYTRSCVHLLGTVSFSIYVILYIFQIYSRIFIHSKSSWQNPWLRMAAHASQNHFFHKLWLVTSLQLYYHILMKDVHHHYEQICQLCIPRSMNKILYRFTSIATKVYLCIWSMLNQWAVVTFTCAIDWINIGWGYRHFVCPAPDRHLN